MGKFAESFSLIHLVVQDELWSQDLVTDLVSNKTKSIEGSGAGRNEAYFLNKRSAEVYELLWSKDLSSVGVAIQEQLRKN